MFESIRKKARSVIVKMIFDILRNRLLSQISPFQNPSLLILSYPRSGSSWVGKILSTSRNAAYLREPITQPYMVSHGGQHALVDIDSDKLAYSIYRKLGDEVFRGIPPRHHQVVNNLSDFMYPNRKQKHIMIKEVNPRATQFYCEMYKPNILFLLRHPGAIALSFYELGWLNSADVQTDDGDPTAGVWAKFGYSYGLVMHNAIETLKTHGNYEIVFYELLAEDPYTAFGRIFDTLNIKPPDNYDQVIEKYCYSSKDETHKGEIERTSKNMIFKWMDKLTNQQIIELRGGYLRSPLKYYREEKDWTRTNGDVLN